MFMVIDQLKGSPQDYLGNDLDGRDLFNYYPRHCTLVWKRIRPHRDKTPEIKIKDLFTISFTI